jgi:hypothetical protein
VGASCWEWSKMYEFLEVDDFSNEYQEYAYHFVDVRIYSLHKISSRPIPMPYTYMVHWIICHVSSYTCTILSDSEQVVGSFRLDALEEMYALPTPKTNIDKHVIDAFV